MERRIRIAPLLLTALIAAALLGTAGFAVAVEKTKKTATKSAVTAKPELTVESVKPEAKAPSEEEMMAAMMKMAAPGPDHEALNPLAGSWKIVTKAWNGPTGDPVVNDGTCERSWTMGKRYLVANYKGEFSKMPFEGMEVLGYDNMKKRYVSSWVDNMGTGILLSEGAPMDQGTKSFTLTGSSTDPMGQSATMRQVTTIVDNNTYTMTMFGAQGGQEMKMMEITYTRVK